jgi:hypothetical protein
VTLLSGSRALALAVALALGATLAARAERVALSVFLGLVAIPVGLYAALAVQRVLIVLAVATVLTGAAVISFWIYEFVTFPWAR